MKQEQIKAKAKEYFPNDEFKQQAIIDAINWATNELEKENAELKEKLKTAYRKGMRHMAKALKDYDRTDGAWTDYFEHTVNKVLQREQLDFEEYGTLADQLIKAKDLLKQWLQTSKASGCDNINIVTDTEQFLKE